METDERANQIIITDYNDNLRLVAQIIPSVLDTKTSQSDVLVRVIPLKNVNAEDLVKDVVPLYQKLSSKTPGEVIEISANDRANSLIVAFRASPIFDGISKLVTALDTAMRKTR